MPTSAGEARRLGELLHGLADVAATDDRPVAGLALDSRKVSPGDLFLAVAGSNSDGRRFIADAVAKGAIAVAREHGGEDDELRDDAGVPEYAVSDLAAHIGGIADRFYGSPSTRLRTVGVTGTNGKSTCAWLIARSLDSLGERCALMGTIGSGFPNALKPAALTTGDAISVQAKLAEMLRLGATAVCMEVSSHGLEQGRVNGVCFDIAVFTNLSQDHLDYHHTMAAYGSAKRRLFQFESLGCAVINVDDEFGATLVDDNKARSVLRYGSAAGAMQATNISLSRHGTTFDVEFDGQRLEVRTRLLGRINVPNILATLATLVACGYSLAAAIDAVADVPPPPGRMEQFGSDGGRPCVIVDYAHTPDALARSLASLRELGDGALTVVFGCGGDRDRGKRAQMGAVAERLADRVILTNDNPRSEEPAAIAADICRGLQQEPTVLLDRERAIEAAIGEAAAADIVLVAGKGHETTQSAGGEVRAFSDREIVEHYLGQER